MSGLGHLTLPSLTGEDLEAVLGDNPSVQTDADETETGTEVSIEQSESDEASVEDWESRFKGLQGTVTQSRENERLLREQNTLLQRQMAQTQEQMFNAHIAELPEEEQAQARAAHQILQQNQGLHQQYQHAQHELQQLYGLVNHVGKELAAREYSTKYGVPLEDLKLFDSEEQMKAHALAVQKLRNQETKRKKRESAPNFEEGTVSHSTPKKPKTLAEATDLVRSMKLPGT